jgi:hypothetical protein
MNNQAGQMVLGVILAAIYVGIVGRYMPIVTAFPMAHPVMMIAMFGGLGGLMVHYVPEKKPLVLLLTILTIAGLILSEFDVVMSYCLWAIIFGMFISRAVVSLLWGKTG